jgi:hypothetical protein
VTSLGGRLAGVALAFAAGTAAAESGQGGFWWAGVDVGAASLERTYSVTPRTRDTKFAMALSVGYAWDPRLLIGAELGGWLLEASDLFWAINEDPKGEGIQTLYLVARYYPRPDAGLFLKAGYGNVSYWNHRLGESGARGRGGVLGLGKDYGGGASWYVTPSVEFAWGEYDGATSPPGIVQDQRYRAVTFRLGVTFR